MGPMGNGQYQLSSLQNETFGPSHVSWKGTTGGGRGSLKTIVCAKTGAPRQDIFASRSFIHVGCFETYNNLAIA